jgi:hypothetical protein
MEEKDFFNENEVTLPAMLHCPYCRQSESYELRWVRRTKKASLTGGASEQDRRRFAAARSYSVRRDDLVQCKNIRCRKRFEVSGVQSVAFF